MSIAEQEKLILKHQKIHTDLENAREKASKESGKNLNEAQYKKDKAISDDAYPDNAHFIYEIIQNAEDSTYLKNKKAGLEFHLLNNGILILSNQKGFTNKDIDSICYMASGGKIAKKDQFIGEKGLGFRSVFKITNTPCISSNGYEFYFDKQQSYEKPFLLKDYKKPLPEKFVKYDYTAIFLPYSIGTNEIKELERDFQSKIKPKLILFLKKLNSISIIKNDKKYLFIEKENTKNENFELAKLKENDYRQEFYIARKTINVVDIKEEKRNNISEREIVLAYPKELDKTSSNMFAFLPTEIDSRLNFTIQADFLLDTSRGHILENDWNRNLFKEIQLFMIDNINLFQKHSKLKFEYLKYFLQETKSNNKFIDRLYDQTIKEIEDKKIVLSDNETWQKPNSIILLEDNIQIDTKYLKLLFNEKYEKIHPKFKLDNYFIDRFKIQRLSKEELLEQIFIYLDKYNNLNDYKEKDVLYLTKIISKYLKFGRDARKFDEDYLRKIKQSLPIIPKYKTNKKFYLFDSIYISSEYKPKLLIENLTKEDEFDFTKYNFLSDDYLEDRRLIDFIKNIINEQEKDNYKKTIEFFTKYPNILQEYLKNNITERYKKIFDYLLEIQEDNKNKISKIPLLLMQNGNFYDAAHTIYFSNNGEDNNLDVLNKSLFELVQQKHEYKEFLEKVFKVKEADIINMILDQYLPWIKENQQRRNAEHDKKLIKYTKDIIGNFDKFDQEEKQKIKKALCFISSNQKKKYLKSNSIYLPQNLIEIIFNNNSIEKYIADKSYFNFLDNKYNQIFENLNEEKLKSFFKYFDFEQYLKEDDISNFIKNIKKDLDLEHNIDALEFIVKSMEYSNIDKLKKFKVYTNKKGSKKEIQAIFFEQVKNFDIDYLHEDYRKKIKDLDKVKQYFQSPYDIDCFIDYLKQDISFNKAVEVYKYLDYKSEFNPNKQQRGNVTITSQKLRQYFKDDKLIYNEECKKFYPEDVTWREEKSSNQTFALSTIYPKELENFFIKKVQVSQSKDIRQIVNKIKDIKEKSDDYFDLLIDLNGLINENSELDKYYDSFDNNTPPVKDKYIDLKKFIAKKEQIFILDSDNKNSSGNFYFNDLEISDYDEKLKSKIFSVSYRYPVNHYSALIDSLSIKRLSSFEKSYENWSLINKYDIENYRKMLEFAYDLLFTKFPDQYKGLESRASELKELNLVNTINIYEDIISQISINDTKIKLDSITSYFENNELNIIDENDLFKIIAGKIGHISEDSIEMFYDKVIYGFKSQEEYYKEKHITKKQSFILEISNVIEDDNQEEDEFFKDKDEIDFDEDNGSFQETGENDVDKEEEISAEEARRNRQKSGAEQVREHNKKVSNNQNETSPSNLIDKNEYIKRQKSKLQKISSTSSKLSQRTRKKSSNIDYRVGEEETKDFFRKRDQYLGQCQICGFTFTTKNAQNYCERFTWSDYKRVKIKANFVDAGNSLCLCAKCHSIIKGGGDFEATFLTDETFGMLNILKDDYDYDTFIEDIHSDKLLNPPDCFKDHIEFNDMYFVDIRLNNNDERIYFTEEHLLMFFEFLKS